MKNDLYTTATATWTDVCPLESIVPDTGVCARVHGRHVAVFRIGQNQLYAIDNVDPKSGSSVLARGLVGSVGARVVVASPLYKNHFDLATGECLEAPEQSVQVYAARTEGGRVLIALQ